MKTKSLLIITVVLFLSSCVKDFINKHPDNKDDVVFTSTNYVYEPQLYVQFLETETETAEERRDYLNDLINNGKGDTKDVQERDALNQRILYLNNESNKALSNIEDLILPKPIPCQGELGFELCFPALDKIVYPIDFEVIGLTLQDKNQKLLFDSQKTEFLPVPGLENFASFQEIDLADFSGEIVFIVNRKDSLGKEISYSVSGLK